MEHLPIKLTIVLILFIIVLHTSNAIKRCNFNAIKKSRFVNTDTEIKRFDKSLIIPPPIPPIPPLPPLMPFISPEEIINNSRRNKAEVIYMYPIWKRRKDDLMDTLKRKPDLPHHQYTISTIMPPTPYPQITTTTPPITYPQITTSTPRSTYPQITTTTLESLITIQRGTTSTTTAMPPNTYSQITTTTLRPMTTTQPATTTSVLVPLTTTELTTGSDSDGFGKLIVGLLVAGALVLLAYFLLWEITFIVPFILFIPIIWLIPTATLPVGPPGLPGGNYKPPCDKNSKPPKDNGNNNDNNDNNDDSDDDDDDEDCEKSQNKKSKEECEKKKKERKSCKVKIKEISDDYPLIIQHTDNSKFMYPQSKGKIVLQPDDKITFGCNTADTYFCKNITIIENVVTHTESIISSMSCTFSSMKIRSKIKFLRGYFGRKSQYQKFQIGLSYGSNFIPTITGYYNVGLKGTNFVRSTLSSALGYKQKEPPQRKLQQDLHEWSPYIYSLSQQQDTFSQLLQCHGNSTHEGDCNYVNRGSYLEPALLTPASHFVYTRAAGTAYYYMNSAPMWNTIRNGNWDKIEKHVQRMASSLKKDLIVLTGVYGQLQLPDYGGLYEDIFMKADYEKCSKSIVVPLYFWKMVYDPVSGNGKPSGIVYVTVNNPFMDSKNYYKICQKPGQSVEGESPAGWRPNSFKSGFSYVCAVDDFILTTGLDLVDRLS